MDLRALQQDTPDKGQLKIRVNGRNDGRPVPDAKVSILNTQVKGMRELIRSKKEEITL